MTQNKRAIVIEDEAEIADLLTMMLQTLGYDVRHADTPKTAKDMIEQAHQDKQPFVVATVDKQFEIGKRGTEMALGYDLIKDIKQKYPYIATIMITADVHEPQEILYLRDEYDVDQFLHKTGLDTNRLRTAIERATHRVGEQIKLQHIPYVPDTPSQYAKPDHMNVKPLFGVPSTLSALACDVFMIMPFAEDYQHIWRDTIQPTVSQMNLTIKRGDDFFTQHDIIQEIWSAMCSSRFVIADVSGLNANVFYELGMAHTIGKPAILITQNIERIPFDIRTRRVITYQDSEIGLLKFREELRTAIHSLMSDESV